MNIELIVGGFLGSGVLGAAIAAVVNYATNKAAVRVDEFEAITTALNKRIDDLKEELGAVKEAFDEEQTEHRETKRRLRAALRHIRAMMAWLGTDRSTEPPDVPRELVDEL